MLEKIQKALQNKYRFESKTVKLSLEDLFDLELSGGRISLDEVAKTINRALKQEEEESFVSNKSKKVSILQDKLDIVKYVIQLKVTEQEKAKAKAENDSFNKEIDLLIAAKKTEGMKALSVEELEKLRR